MLWLAAAALSGALAIWGKHPDRMLVHWVAKPATIVLVIVATFMAPSVLPGPGRVMLIMAQVLSLAGDVLLMLSARLLVWGLVSFLLAHVSYIAAFSLDVSWTAGQLPWLAAPAVVALPVMRSLWPHLGPLRGAVLVYMGALVALAWRLLARFDALPELGVAAWGVGALGGALFLLADALLARRRFAGAAVPYALELGAYFAAQACIARSTWAI